MCDSNKSAVKSMHRMCILMLQGRPVGTSGLCEVGQTCILGPEMVEICLKNARASSGLRLPTELPSHMAQRCASGYLEGIQSSVSLLPLLLQRNIIGKCMK